MSSHSNNDGGNGGGGGESKTPIPGVIGVGVGVGGGGGGLGGIGSDWMDFPMDQSVPVNLDGSEQKDEDEDEGEGEEENTEKMKSASATTGTSTSASNDATEGGGGVEGGEGGGEEDLLGDGRGSPAGYVSVSTPTTNAPTSSASASASSWFGTTQQQKQPPPPPPPPPRQQQQPQNQPKQHQQHHQHQQQQQQQAHVPNQAGMTSSSSSSSSQQAAVMTDESGGGDRGLFFADAMLDLDEAHDFAETPEPRKVLVDVNNPTKLLGGPMLPTSAALNSTSSQSHHPHPQQQQQQQQQQQHPQQQHPQQQNQQNTNQHQIQQQQHQQQQQQLQQKQGPGHHEIELPSLTDDGIAPNQSTLVGGPNGQHLASTTEPSVSTSTTSSSTIQQQASFHGHVHPSHGHGHGNDHDRRNDANNHQHNDADRPMRKVTNRPMIPDPGSYRSSTSASAHHNYRPRPPRVPRDIPWMVAFLLFCPLAMLICTLLSPSHRYGSAIALSKAPRRATFYALWFALVATLALGRVLYRTAAGGEGDAARHVASRILLTFVPLSLGVHPLLIVLILWKTPRASWFYLFLPLWFVFRDVWAMRRMRTTASTAGGRQAFFRALLNMALDIVSRSLRRSSFLRFVTAIVVVQFVVTLWWRRALLGALGRGSYGWFFIAAISGKWATGTVARLLGYVASGGVTSWFVQQSIVVEETRRKYHERQQKQQEGAASNANANAKTGTTNDADDDDDDDDDLGGIDVAVPAGQGMSSAAPATGGGGGGGGGDDDDVFGGGAGGGMLGDNPNILEEYRSVHASLYQPIVELDEGIDDDFDDDDDQDDNIMMTPATLDMKNITGSLAEILNHSTGVGSGGGGRGGGRRGGNSQVRGFVVTAVTVSFGSIAQCGLLGGLAQFVWSLLRNSDTLLLVLSSQRGGPSISSSSSSSSTARRRRETRGFRGMAIGSSTRIGGGDGSTADMVHAVATKVLTQLQWMARNFVQSNSDLAMCQVAAYYKSYQRAAHDVAVLVDGSGIEPILHDDITSHICACVCGTISGMIVIFFGLILDRHQVASHITDTTVVQTMLVTFLLCYVLLFTVMEPLRASIKAIYVSFAQYPESLSQTFPLIFHRLTRISEANLV